MKIIDLSRYCVNLRDGVKQTQIKCPYFSYTGFNFIVY